MAQANINTTEEVVMVPQTVQKVAGVTLHLTPEEAITLRLVCNVIGGCPDNSLRKYSDSIGDSLSRIVNLSEEQKKKVNHYIMFHDGIPNMKGMFK